MFVLGEHCASFSFLFYLKVFNAYQAGMGALKLSMKDVTVEKAENLVDQIQEVLK